ncbi:undecaprenyl-diphosphatase [Sporobacter termitidis DSM 10068]|uniref:Undecaprenyl-diphosphatase n=1 Tax=Sporobacter termitidis DSM 10068 TaxID=1123282 RepID=A0A1M5WC08_9FIRM|nr:undecaprenyl-diphosphate phosphatase [Sporobacter termitidis]SHH85036.1 undecaprenyl-diphosphatase [Sporobacter termitidis DSM 10068]
MLLTSSILEIIKSIILGIVEGVTEWLPISSTGHMLLVNEFLKLGESQEFIDMFLVVIQLGAILAVVVLFWNKIIPFGANKKLEEKRQSWSLWGKIIVACIPAMIVGLLLNDQIEALFYHSSVTSVITIAATLIFYGVLFIVIENRNKDQVAKIRTLPQVTYKTALFVGLFQLLSLIPGTSRSGATIIGAILIGTSRVAAAEFTFVLSIPVMFGASLLKLYKFGFDFTGLEVAVLLVGVIVAFIVSLISIRFLMNYVKKHDFKVFGWYRIVLGIIVLVYFLIFA